MSRVGEKWSGSPSIASCFRTKFSNSLYCQPDQFNPIRYLQRKELFENDNLKKAKFCRIPSKYYGRNEEFKCFTECPKDCKFDYFMWDDIKQDYTTPIDVGKSCTAIDIEHNRLPDIIIIHYPEITFIGFISNFGGLLGLWLGLSFDYFWWCAQNYSIR